VDIAAAVGTKVKAPNAGKVVFGEKLKAFGGTMVLDHGQGVHTLYFHLSKLLAEVGAKVEKGTVIALSGNTGVSSGAHLHWGMSVHNLRVDPIQWTKYEI
jgi:murein DD-endopeptidase MepM/ murein hydrolase activator NlpD